MAIQRQTLADVRKLLEQSQRASIRQGLEVLQALEDRELWAVFAEGVSVTTEGRVVIEDGCEIHKRVRVPFRLEVALWALRATGRLEAQTTLNLTLGVGETLEDLDSLTGVASLVELDVRDCAIRTLEGLRGCTGLTRLDLLRCRALTTLEGIRECTSLATLAVCGSDALTDLDDLRGCNALETLAVSGCEALTNVDGLRDCIGLTSLTLSRCPRLTNVDGLRGSAGLTALTVRSCGLLANVDGLRGCTGLTQLDLTDSWGLGNVDGLADCRALEQLVLANCFALANVDGLSACTALQTLDLSKGLSLRSIAGLAGCTSLRELDLHASKVLSNVDGLRGSTSLATLTLEGCVALTNVDGLAGCTSLRTLNLRACAALANLDGLGDCGPLDSLDVHGCGSLTHVDGLANQSRLTKLDLDDLHGLTNLNGLRGCKGLTEVYLSGCLELHDVDGLAGLPVLRVFRANHGRLDQLDGLGACPALTTISHGVHLGGNVRVDATAGCGALEVLDLPVPAVPPSTTAEEQALLRRWAALPRLSRFRVGDRSPAWRYPVDAVDVAGLRALVEAVDACALPRVLPPIAALSADDTAALKELNKAFKQAPTSRDAVPAIDATPRETLRRICGFAGLRVTEEGDVAYDAKASGLRFPRVTQQGELLLALANATGLLDGLTYLSLAKHPHIRDLGALVPHAGTLRFVYEHAEERRVRFGPDLAKHLATVVPLPSARARVTDAEAARAEILRHVHGGTPDGLARAAAVVAEHDEFAWLLEGCALKPISHAFREMRGTLTPRFAAACSGCAGTGRRGAGTCSACSGSGTQPLPSAEAAAPILSALLAAAPEGCAAAQAVLAFDDLLFDAVTHLPWVRHCTSLRHLRLDWDHLDTHGAVFAKLPALRTLTIGGSAPSNEHALTLLRRLPHVRSVTFTTSVPVSLLAALGSSANSATMEL